MTAEPGRLLLCDLDDTVVDRASTFRRWAEGFVSSRSLGPAALEWFLAEDGDGYRPRPELFALAARRFPLGDGVDDLVAGFYREFGSLFRCGPEVRRALQQARRDGWKLALVTNGTPEQETKIRAAGLDRLVDTWCISGVEGCRKPGTRLLRLAAERCRLPLSRAWMVGDSPEADVGAAHAASIPSVWLRRGRAWPLADFRPTAVADDFPAAVDVVLASEP